MFDLNGLDVTIPGLIHGQMLGQFLAPRPEGDISLSWFEVGVAASLLLINAIISIQLGLGMAKRIATSSVRMVIQLAILGLVLKQIFELSQPAPVLALAATMTIIAGVSAVKRIDYRYPSIYRNSIFSVWTSAWIVTSITVLIIVRPQPWYSPQVVIPLLGMVLGNSLTGISLGLDRFMSELRNRRGEVETMLALGATRWESCRGVFVEATRTAMIPILNTMSVAGIVSIPGMMTGQLLAGAEPLEAVKYQIMIMFVIAAAIAIGVVLSLSLSYRNVTNSNHQIEWDQIRRH
ncbi:MAG: iron export ABC transporter permease subunit FetB [Rubripirellula sp.]|nr:iron export ABC transporter permease subunit FetB [Rubripirellula sp.]